MTEEQLATLTDSEKLDFLCVTVSELTRELESVRPLLDKYKKAQNVKAKVFGQRS